MVSGWKHCPGQKLALPMSKTYRGTCWQQQVVFLGTFPDSFATSFDLQLPSVQDVDQPT